MERSDSGAPPHVAGEPSPSTAILPLGAVKEKVGTSLDRRTLVTVDLPTEFARDEPSLADVVGTPELALTPVRVPVAASSLLFDLPAPVLEVGSTPAPSKGPSPTISLVSYTPFVLSLSPLFLSSL